MGVTGLWRLIEPAGKPVPVETLENKVIAVDISIWLHQMVKGYQDTKGAPLPNAHLIGLFQRLCKLLYFRIKPIFVFDGAFPELKKETIAKRQHNKLKYNSESERLKRELALLLSKKTAIGSLLGKDISPKKASTNESNDDLFKLPALPERKDETDSESEDESSSSSIIDLHSVDIESEKFKTLPVKEKYDLLIELKETRKQNSWGRLHELPKKSDNFSDFQLQRLLKRRKVQECLEETEKEMGDGGMSITELESLLNEEGIDTKIESLPTRRIASSNTTRFLLINSVKQALADAKKKELDNKPGTSKEPEVLNENKPAKDELEDDLEKAIKMSLECVDADDEVNNDKNNYTSKTDDSWTSVMTDSDYTEGTDSEEGDGFQQPDLGCAKAYIMQYSDFTNKAINKLVTTKNSAVSSKPAFPKVDEILEELSKEKSIIVDNIDLSSDEESKIKSNVTHTPELVDENDMSVTQSSVIYVENPEQDIVLLDTSTEDNSETNSDLKVINENYSKTAEPEEKLKDDGGSSQAIRRNIDSKVNAAIQLASDSSDNEFEEVPETAFYPTVAQLNKDNHDKTSRDKKNEDFNEIEGNSQDVRSNIGSTVKAEIQSESDSNDDEFEEVPETDSKRTVVELTLNMDEPCDQDDIFADVFTKVEEHPNNSKSESYPIETDVENVNNASKVIENSSSENKPEYCEKKLPLQENKSLVITDTENDKLEKTLPSLIDIESATETDDKPKTDKKVYSDTESSKYDKAEASSSSADMLEETKETTVDVNDTTSKIPNKDTVQSAITVENLNKMAEQVANDEQELIQEKGRLDRIGRNITAQMTSEAQELLQIFGIPYIVAPMEAEAQCAFLESANLTDGTITDDSDIWLFGGKTVYKNFFNQKKHVLQFLSERIERSFNLTREQLVLLALLVGSDYTTGIDGIGPVTALEILASFPFNKKQFLNETSKQARYQQVVAGLQEFKRWVRAGKRTDNVSLKKKLRNVSVTDDFPSIRVVQAYMEPNVEKSEEKFTWGELDITVLRDYTKNKFGWSQNKLDEIINPVLKRLQERKSQKTVHDYFKRKVEFQSLEEHMSKRVKAAVQKMGPDDTKSEDIPIDNEEVIPSKKRKINTKRVKKTANKSTVIPGTVRVSDEVIVADSNVVSSIINSKSNAEIVIPKTQRYQEVIPQREKDKQSLLQNKMKAIELFRKTKIDRKKKHSKRKPLLPKDKAELSESSDSD